VQLSQVIAKSDAVAQQHVTPDVSLSRLVNYLLSNRSQSSKPKNARSKRALEKRDPKLVENFKTTLFLRGEKCSSIVQLALVDLRQLKKPHEIHFTKKNPIHPFEDASSLEFFSEKNDASLLVFGCHSKKRPHCITLVRMFMHKVLDMLELYIDPESLRTISQFKGNKAGAGMKPMIAFSGTLFESPVPNAYTLAKSLFLDLFKGEEAGSVDVEGLQYMIHIAAGEEEGEASGIAKLPTIHLRVYKIITKKSGQKLPRVEVEEMGPRMAFRVGRLQQADDAVMKEALKKPKQLEPKTKKNISMDEIGDKIGRIHVGKQDLGKLQTRKMKGLKRSRDQVDEAQGGAEDGGIEGDGVESDIEEGGPVKKVRD
jgi:ribosome production factor 2